MIVVIDYNMGNTGSVRNALDYLGRQSVITADLKNLEELGLIRTLEEEVIRKGKPILGLCLGMQMLASVGEEGGERAGLGWISGRVRKLEAAESGLPLPHVGWNDVEPVSGAILFKDIKNPIFYFVHSYHLVPEDKNIISATTEYGKKFVSAVKQKNIFGLQFHPEKSQQAGLDVLANFLSQ